MKTLYTTYHHGCTGTKRPVRQKPLNQLRSRQSDREDIGTAVLLLWQWHHPLWCLSLKSNKYPECLCRTVQWASTHCSAMTPNRRLGGVIVQSVEALWGESLTTKWCWRSVSGTEQFKDGWPVTRKSWHKNRRKEQSNKICFSSVRIWILFNMGCCYNWRKSSYIWALSLLLLALSACYCHTRWS